MATGTGQPFVLHLFRGKKKVAFLKRSSQITQPVWKLMHSVCPGTCVGFLLILNQVSGMPKEAFNSAALHPAILATIPLELVGPSPEMENDHQSSQQSAWFRVPVVLECFLWLHRPTAHSLWFLNMSWKPVDIFFPDMVLYHREYHNVPFSPSFIARRGSWFVPDQVSAGNLRTRNREPLGPQMAGHFFEFWF